MSKLVVIRVGDPAGTWATARQSGKYSTPESQTQAVRNLYMEGNRVVVLFVGTNDVPLKLATVDRVRPKFPTEDSNPELQTYMEWSESFDIEAADPEIFEKLRTSIRYTRGQQVIPDGCASAHVLAFFQGLCFPRAAVQPAPAPAVPLNTTVVFNR